MSRISRETGSTDQRCCNETQVSNRGSSHENKSTSDGNKPPVNANGRRVVVGRTLILTGTMDAFQVMKQQDWIVS